LKCTHDYFHKSLIHAVFRGLPNDVVKVWKSYVFIRGRTYSSFLQNLDIVLSRITAWGFYIPPSNCQFATRILLIENSVHRFQYIRPYNQPIDSDADSYDEIESEENDSDESESDENDSDERESDENDSDEGE